MTLRQIRWNISHALQCDGATPLCSPCRNRSVQCVYSSNPGISRLVALKSEHKQLTSSHDNLMQLYRRLKQGSASEVSAIIKQIKLSDEILDISVHEGRLPQSQGCVQLAAHQPELVGQSVKLHSGSSALSERGISLALNPTSESTSSSPYAPRHAEVIALPSSHYDDGYLGDPPTTKWHATFRRAFYTNVELENAVCSSLILRSWNIEVREIHNTEQFESLFSFLCHKENACIPRSRLCEMCAVAATSGQYVKHLLAVGLINYWYGKLPLGV
jgi:hypothetical protein